MISYVPEDTFHIIEKKKKGFIRKSKGKIKPHMANLLTLQISVSPQICLGGRMFVLIF